MGDFEDIFGAGADAAEIIEGFAQDYARASHVERANWRGAASTDENRRAEAKDADDTWERSMKSKGYERGPFFANYLDLTAWEEKNDRPHVRKPNVNGFRIYFTD